MEGSETEPAYLEGVCRELRLPSVQLRGPAGVPKTMVESAVSDRKQYDEVWCVFDVDSHPNLADAKQQALANDINVAVSNPCFELFLLLHYQYYSKPCSRQEVRRKLSRHLPTYDKKINFHQFWPIYPTAKTNHQRLEAWHLTRGTNGNSPSTAVIVLIESLQAHRLKLDGKDT